MNFSHSRSSGFSYMQKRKLSSFLSALTVLVMLLSACAPPPATPAPTEAAAAPTAAPPTAAPPTAAPAPTEAPAASPAGVFPIVSEPTTLKVFMCPGPFVSDYQDNEYTYWLQEMSGITLEIEVPPLADAAAKMNLMLASGDFPDVIIGCLIGLDQQNVLAEQGVLVALDDYIADYGTEFAKVFENFPQIQGLITLADGKIYGLPDINECYHCSLGQKMWLYQPWMDKLGLGMPTTTEEFYQVLKAFKERDPNGNGKKDEIPLSGTQRSPGGWNTQLDRFIMNSFVFNDVSTDNGAPSLMVENGTIKAAFNQPGWREGLVYMRRLYSEGLIDPQAFTNDSPLIKALGENPDTVLLGATGAGWWGHFVQNGGPSGRFKEYTAIRPLIGPSGMRQVPFNSYVVTGGKAQFVITSAAKNPLAAFRLADLMYSWEGSIRGSSGVLGEDWENLSADTKMVGVDGGKATWNQLNVWSGVEHNRHWNQRTPRYLDMAIRMGMAYNPIDPLERRLYEYTRDLMEPYQTKDKGVPPMALSSEQSKVFGDLKVNIYTVVDEWFANFIMGNNDINTEWEDYNAALDEAGLAAFLEIYQENYDAKYK